MTRPPLELLLEQWEEGLPGSPEETCAMRACAAQLREALRAQAEADAGEIEALRDEHEALRLAENGSYPQLRRLRGRIDELVCQMESHQLSAMRVASVRERVEEARRWAAAALAQADAADGAGGAGAGGAR